MQSSNCIACKGCECGGVPIGRLRISQAILFDREAAAFVVKDGDRVLAHVARPEREPSIEGVTLERGDNLCALRWRSAHPDGIALLQGIAVTYDDGERWQRLAIGLRGATFRFDPRALAGGERCRLRIYATDGFNTSYADSKSFALPLKTPLMALLDPEDGATVKARELTHLQVEAILPRFGSLEGEAIRWESDRQDALGVGRELWIHLRKGEHRITVTAQNGPDSVSQTQFTVRSI